jgi:putative transposase
MPKKHLGPEQIIPLLRQVEVELANGKSLPEACRAAGIIPNTYYRWKRKFGGMHIDEAKRMKEIEKENAQLRRLVASQALDIQILKEVARGKF